MYIIGLIAAVWVFGDARKHNYNFLMSLLWAGGTAAFIPIFLPLYILIGRRRIIMPKEEPRQIKDSIIEGEAEFIGEEIICPMCAKSVRKDYKHCPHCGFSLHLKCECGCDLERTWKVCPECGKPTERK
jgi:hypothetical protein